tara:strand:- start:70 stop:1089 length:1020 start_codon:yes stop_codon:yes gene_type:complete
MLEQNIEQKTPKNAKKRHCLKCDFVCSKHSEWERHIFTSKHKNRTKMNVLEQNIEQKTPKNATSYMCCCGKSYTARNSLWYHKQKNLPTCQETETPKKTPLDEYEEEYDINNPNNTDVNNDLLITIVDKLSKLSEKNDEKLINVIKEIMPHIQGTLTNTHSNNTYNTNNTNNINNNFNIQMFLNDKCKNAMNLTDFIDTLPITSETYDNTIENGLTKTITNMFLEGLNNLDLLERPIHCTDPSRKTLYIKENDVWEKDNNLIAIEDGITKIALKQRTTISKWQDANSGWDKDENLQTKMTNLVFNSMTQIEKDDKETNKIIRAISKSTHLSHGIKEEYR